MRAVLNRCVENPVFQLDAASRVLTGRTDFMRLRSDAFALGGGGRLLSTSAQLQRRWLNHILLNCIFIRRSICSLTLSAFTFFRMYFSCWNRYTPFLLIFVTRPLSFSHLPPEDLIYPPLFLHSLPMCLAISFSTKFLISCFHHSYSLFLNLKSLTADWLYLEKKKVVRS